MEYIHKQCPTNIELRAQKLKFIKPFKVILPHGMR